MHIKSEITFEEKCAEKRVRKSVKINISQGPDCWITGPKFITAVSDTGDKSRKGFFPLLLTPAINLQSVSLTPEINF